MLPTTVLALTAVLAAAADPVPGHAPQANVAEDDNQRAQGAAAGRAEASRGQGPSGSEVATTDDPVASFSPEQRLAGRYARMARLLVQDDEKLTSLAVRTASYLVERSMVLDPTEAEYRRLAIDLALLCDREDLYERALSELATLDPGDDTVHLRQINLLLDRFNTVEERVAAIDQILGGKSADQLSPAIISRLALSKALMLRRSGDVEGFADALAAAVEADPFHPSAVAIAAGFFRMNVDDPAAEAELLATVVIADPTDIPAQLGFAQLALENAAYAAAAKFFNLAIENRRILRQPGNAHLLADYAVARWGAGQPDAALTIVRKVQAEADDQLRMLYWRHRTDITPEERGAISARIEPTLATIRAAILAYRGDPGAVQALEDLRAVYERLIDPRLPDLGEEFEETATAPEPPSDERIAELKLQLAWTLLWLGGSMEEARTLIDEADAIRPVDDVARSRFEALLALRSGDPAAATELLEPIAADDPVARFSLAQAYDALGRTKDAARALLDVARAKPGSIIGIWAANQLTDILGRSVPISDAAREINRVVADIPPAYFEYPEGLNRAVQIVLKAPQTTVDALQPIPLELHVINHSPFPLAIDEEGPIRPEVVLNFDSTLIAQRRDRRQLPPVVVDIGRRLRLEPRETLVAPVDLRRHQIGKLIDEAPLMGTFITVKAWLNPSLQRQGVLQRGLLSGQDETSPIRVNGARLNQEWLSETIRLFDRSEIDDQVLTRMALVAHLIGLDLGVDPDPGQARILNTLRTRFNDAFLRLEDMEAAWVLAQIPPDALSREIRSLVQQTTDRDVLLIYLLVHVRSPEDPALEYALRQGDPIIRHIANQYRLMLQRQAELEGTQREGVGMGR